MMQTSTTAATELASQLRLSVMRLARVLRQQVTGPVTPSQVSALHQIERLAPVTLGALATAERVQPPSMTRIVAGLEENGLVVREVDADDRRIARLHLTSAGRRWLERSRSRKTAYLAARLRRLSPEELDALERAVPVLEHLLAEEQ